MVIKQCLLDNDDDDGRSGFFKEDGVVGIDILIFLDDEDAVGCSNFKLS